jgi:hypothetical protein
MPVYAISAIQYKYYIIIMNYNDKYNYNDNYYTNFITALEP